MKVTKQASLKQLNTFRIDAQTDFLIEIEKEEDILNFSNSKNAKNENIFILGGGSNVLFSKDYNGVILHSSISDIETINDTESYVEVKCGSGVEWDGFVEFCVNKNWGGIENLSDIPGTVGAAPVQNIGAYGVEAKDTIIRVEGYNYKTGKPFLFNNKECDFSYRNSIFKNNESKNYFITFVHFQLTKNPKLITHYGGIEEQLQKIGERSIQTLRSTIIDIRRSKLPSIDELGSGGSFFKNPIVEIDFMEKLIKQFPEMPNYKQPENKFKLSAAWLIDQSGLKAYRSGDVGTYPSQPLVIVNYGKASGNEIALFSELIQQKVFETFAIKLEPEVIFK
jgi:UDP-N-acetylmuramate dehydrogenase